MSNAYANPMGTWKVTTEGDCEGRSVQDLGIFTGYVDEIALALADRCYYSLEFTAIEPTTVPLQQNSVAKEVHVHFNVSSNTWGLKSPERAAIATQVFKDRPVRIGESCYYASFKIIRGKTETESKQEIDHIKRRAALAKLTAEEKAILGLA